MTGTMSWRHTHLHTGTMSPRTNHLPNTGTMSWRVRTRAIDAAAMAMPVNAAIVRLLLMSDFLRGCRVCCGWSGRGLRCGESAQEVAAVSGPYEAFGDGRIAFIVDL